MKVLLASMEAGIWSDVPTYAGGLGVLVGDKLLAARDMGKRVESLTFSYPLGYASVRVVDGKPLIEPGIYDPLKRFKLKESFELRTRFGRVEVQLLKKGRSWFIHTPLAQRLYIDTPEERLKKEIILGMVAARLADGYDVLHLEESHAALAGHFYRGSARIVFTTHTPLPHGHEVWERSLVRKLLGWDRELNMTRLALEHASYVNCVSRMQRELMNPYLDGRADYITNGVHRRWIYRGNARARLARLVNERAYRSADFGDRFTIGIARRFTGYKRLDLPVRVLDRLAELPVQIVYSGNVHPADGQGIEMLQRVLDAIGGSKLPIAYLPGYDIDTAKLMVAGSDVWLNLPVESKEASGTSWMKAMLNGTVPVTTASGSVPEFCRDGENALIIPAGPEEQQASFLVQKIGEALKRHDELSEAARQTEGLSAERMMREYFERAYLSHS